MTLQAAYKPRADFVTDLVSPNDLVGLCALLTRQNSLPRVAPDVDLSGMSDRALERFVAVVHELQLHEARNDAACFVEYALTNELTGEQLRNAPHHNEWHDFLDANDLAVLFAPVEHAKTTHVAVGRVLFKLGKNPNLRLAIISNTSTQAEKVLGAVRLNIETNPRVREVFPKLLPSERHGDPWHSKAITVQRSTIARDPSIQALGVAGPLVGARLDGVVVDDVLDFENTRTPDQMQKVVEWFETTLLTRMTAGAWIHVIGTPWSTSDLLHVLEARPGFRSRRYSAVENPNDPPALWRPIWPEQFSRERLFAKYEGMSPSNFVRKYFCLVTSNETARFRIEWLDRAAELGKLYMQFPLAPLKTQGGRPLRHFTGVDLAVGKNSSSDLTVLFTLALTDDDKRIIVDIQSGRWQAPEILARLKATQARYDSLTVVEDNGAQSFLLQWALDWQIPVVPFTTGRNKYDEHFGIESIAVEMRQEQWIMPSGKGLDPELALFRQGCLNYQPDAHTADHLMAAWFAREGARTRSMPVGRRMDTMSR